MIAQFDATISRGERYLGPGSRVMAASLICLAIVTSRHPDDAVAAQWKYHVTAGVLLAQVFWYEIIYIFPINREVRAMGAKFEGNEDRLLPEGEQRNLVSRLQKWRLLNAGRIVLPLITSCISLAAVL